MFSITLRRKGNVKMSFQIVDYKSLHRRVKNDKFELLFDSKPALNPIVHCAFHTSEGCGDCLYINRCQLNEDGFFIEDI